MEDGSPDKEDDPHPPFPESVPPKFDAFFPKIEATPTNKVSGTNGMKPEVTTWDEHSDSRYALSGVFIGCALPHCCRDQHDRPRAHAIVNNLGSVVAYIPARYSIRNVNKGEILISVNGGGQ